MSRLEHYAGRDDITFRYRSHRTGKEERLVMSGDEFMERFSWHVPEKRFRMVRYYGFLSPPKRAVLDVVYVLTETVRRTARKITWRGLYQRLVKTAPLKCILCGSQMCFSGLKRGLRLPDLAGLPWAAGAGENLRLAANAGKIRPESRKSSKKRQLIDISDENDVIDWFFDDRRVCQSWPEGKNSGFFYSFFGFISYQ